jgi:hypothetical protein
VRAGARRRRSGWPASRGRGSGQTSELEVGGAIGIAVIGSIRSAVYSTRVDTGGLSPETAGKVKSSFAVAAQLAPPIPDHAQTAFIDAMKISSLSAAGAALAAVVALLLDPGADPGGLDTSRASWASCRAARRRIPARRRTGRRT